MSEAYKPSLRWLGLGLLVMAIATLGWYVGSRFGSESPDGDAAPRQTGGEVHRDITGEVVRLAPDDGVLTVDHEEIEGFMSAMVMDLQVAEPAELEGLEAGDAIVFDLARIGGTYQAIRIRPASGEGQAPQDAMRPEQAANALGRGDMVPDLVLFDAEGERFQLHEMEPRHKLITFFYVRCPLENFCPAQTQRLARLQAQLETKGSDLHLVSLTLDAEHDGPDVLAGYQQRFEVDPGRWTLAGGEDPEAIREFAHRAGGRIRSHEQGFEIDHALIALRVDGNRIVDHVYGLEAIADLVERF